MKLRNLSSRNLYLRDSSGNEYRVNAYSDITVSDNLWTDNEFRRWLRYRIRDIATVDTSASITASTLINTGDPLSVPFTVRGAGGQSTDLIQLQDSSLNVLLHITQTGTIGIGTSPLTPLEVKGAITGSGGQIRIDASSSNTNAALSLFPNRSGSLFEAARILGTYNGANQGQLQIFTNDGSGTLQQRAMFDETGNFGIGVTPTKRFDVGTSSTGDIATFRTTASGGQGILHGIDTTNTRAYVRLNTNSTYSYAVLDISGNPIISFKSSDGKTYLGSVQDTNLYRSAISTLKTDGSFVVGADMTVTGSLTTGSLNFTGGSVTGALTVTQDITARSGGATQVLVGTVSSNAGISFGLTHDANLYRSGANLLEIDSSLRFAAITGGTAAIRMAQPAINTVLRNRLLEADTQNNFSIGGDGTIQWGVGGSTAPDTNLYRSAASTLKTDQNLVALSFTTTGNLSLQSRTANDLSLINTNTNGTISMRLSPGGVATDVITVSSIGNITLPITAANTTPTITLGAETLYRPLAGKLKTDSIFNAVGGFQVNGTNLAAVHLSDGTTGSGTIALSVSPALTGSPTATTPLTSDNSTRIATTAWANAQGYALLASSPIFTGFLTASAYIASGTAPRFIMNATVGGSDSKRWDWFTTATQLVGRTLTDADVPGVTWLQVTRSGTSVSSVDVINSPLTNRGMNVQRHPYGNDRHTESGTTASFSTTVSITFTDPFGSTPTVVVSGDAGKLIPGKSAVSTTGATFGVGSAQSGATVAYWIAEGAD